MQRQKPDPQDDLWSTAWAIEFGEQRFQVIKEDMYEEGMEKGMQTILLQLIHSR